MRSTTLPDMVGMILTAMMVILVIGGGVVSAYLVERRGSRSQDAASTASHDASHAVGVSDGFAGP